MSSTGLRVAINGLREKLAARLYLIDFPNQLDNFELEPIDKRKWSGSDEEY